MRYSNTKCVRYIQDFPVSTLILLIRLDGVDWGWRSEWIADSPRKRFGLITLRETTMKLNISHHPCDDYRATWEEPSERRWLLLKISFSYRGNQTVRTDSFPLIVDEKPHVKAKSIHPLGNEEEKAVAVHDALIHRSMLNVLPLVTVSRSSDSLFFSSTKERMCCTKPFEATRSQTDKANCNVLLLLSALSRDAIICLHVS